LRQSVTLKQQLGRAVDDAVSADVIDRAAGAYDKDFLFRQSTQQKRLLQMVEEALQRIRDRSFGQCLSCGNEINLKWLEAVPWTPLLRCVPGENGTSPLTNSRRFCPAETETANIPTVATFVRQPMGAARLLSWRHCSAVRPCRPSHEPAVCIGAASNRPPTESV
jgi:RNA polymerase-binding transcription factor DksA